MPYQYEPEKVKDNDEVKIHWNRTGIDRTMTAYRSDIQYIKRKRRKHLIGIAVSNTRSIDKTIKTKKEKYKNLAMEIKYQKQANSAIIQVVIHATSVIRYKTIKRPE